jgi:hypothetical protein
MAIKGLEGMSNEQLDLELNKGGKFVIFEYTISILIMTFKRPSAIHFVKYGEGSFGKALPYVLITLLFGWWGIPWGPIYSIGSLITDLGGGKDVTNEVIAQVKRGQA